MTDKEWGGTSGAPSARSSGSRSVSLRSSGASELPKVRRAPARNARDVALALAADPWRHAVDGKVPRSTQ